MNPEFDAMLERFFSTIPIDQRLQALGQVLNHTSNQITVIPLFYGAEPAMVNNRIQRVTPRKAQEGTMGWNAYEWDTLDQ